MNPQEPGRAIAVGLGRCCEDTLAKLIVSHLVLQPGPHHLFSHRSQSDLSACKPECLPSLKLFHCPQNKIHALSPPPCHVSLFASLLLLCLYRQSPSVSSMVLVPRRQGLSSLCPLMLEPPCLGWLAAPQLQASEEKSSSGKPSRSPRQSV